MSEKEAIKRRYHIIAEYEKARIMELKGQGKNILQISGILGLKYTQVNHFIKKMTSPIAIYKKTGRPKKIDDEIRKKIIEMTLSNRKLPLRENQQQILSNGISISIESIRQIRHQEGLEWLEPIKRPPLTKTHMNARVKFAQNILEQYDNNQLPNIIFTDESTMVQDLNSQKIWRYKGEIYEQAVSICEHHPISVMIWGGIGYNFKTQLLWFKGKVNSKVYCDMLLKNEINVQCSNSFPNYLFQQDGAKPHVSNYTKSMLCSKFPILQGWPALSPDLSPIEMIWSLIKKKLKGRVFNTKEELWHACQEEWKNIPMETVNKLMHSKSG